MKLLSVTRLDSKNKHLGRSAIEVSAAPVSDDRGRVCASVVWGRQKRIYSLHLEEGESLQPFNASVQEIYYI